MRNSRSSPLSIAEILFEESEGRLGLTICPGKKDRTSLWDRDLGSDLLAIRSWNASTVVSLIEEHEFSLLSVETLGVDIQRLGMRWLHLPIRDIDVPDARFVAAWSIAGAEIHERIDAGERILIHCRGGLGRTGLLAALILVERGCAPRDAINRVRAVRPHAIETFAQESYVYGAQVNSEVASK
jgi:ADP-ribosyl-[dinitrogen reductase] hydrolase